MAVTYIANEGVLISSGGKQILIDGLHREYKPAYAFPPPALLESLESARSPYDKLNLILVTHIHLDHFHPQSIGLHLANNPAAVLVSSDQVADGVKKDFADFQKIESRVKRSTPQWKAKEVHEVAGVKLSVLGLRHGTAHFSWIQNLGYVVEIDGKKLLHIGDADLTEENFRSFRLDQEKIDVAFIPYWYLLSSRGRSIVREMIKPKHILAVHISPAEAVQVAEQLKGVVPEAIALTKILETKNF
ncbi:MAG TPA: MBL fold metallo-hydrolase [Pyrinomonadaceae bacterium]|nr:MBL fold metallo-hydrolase [Pyrinomonadaceae bacterium]